MKCYYCGEAGDYYGPGYSDDPPDYPDNMMLCEACYESVKSYNETRR